VSNTQVTLFQQEGGAKLSDKFKPLVSAGVGADLGDGIRGSYGIVGIKAGKFRLKYKGEETVLMDGDSPVGFIDVVIVKANGFLNKQYFKGKYVEGNTSPPVCYSLDGVVPSDASPEKQATSCALCPKNQFGSLIGDNGVKQKACRDTKKLAVVPLQDIKNATMGGAMLFRVPPSSLKDLSVMADQLKGRGYPYNSVAVRIAFDLEASHPKPIFKALRPLNDEEADDVLEMFESDSVLRVLADNDIVADHGEEAVGTAQPVTPAGAKPHRDVPLMPTEEERRPVPQAKTMPPVMPPPLSEVAAQLAAGAVMIAPATTGRVAMPTAETGAPKVLRVQPDEPLPHKPANPFAPPALHAAAGAAAAPTQTAKVAAVNPFAPKPAKEKKARVPKEVPAPVAVDVPTAVQAEAPAETTPAATQLDTDINSILSGLSMG
jgi:hypothetical protein